MITSETFCVERNLKQKFVRNVSVAGNPTESSSVTIHLTRSTTSPMPTCQVAIPIGQDPSSSSAEKQTWEKWLKEKHRWSGFASGGPYAGLSGSGVCIRSRMGPARSSNLIGSSTSIVVGGWPAAHCARNVPSGRGSAQQCNVPAGMNVPKCESAQCGMCAPSDTHSYYVTVALARHRAHHFHRHHPTLTSWSGKTADPRQFCTTPPGGILVGSSSKSLVSIPTVTISNPDQPLLGSPPPILGFWMVIPPD